MPLAAFVGGSYWRRHTIRTIVLTEEVRPGPRFNRIFIWLLPVFAIGALTFLMPVHDIAPTVVTEDARIELRAIMWIGRGDFSAGEWDKALTQADGSSSLTVIDTLAEKADLHDYLMKGLYNLDLL